MFGVLNKNQMEEVIKMQPVGRLACCQDNIPYIVPISYAYDGRFIYCHAEEGKKIDIMRNNPHICFQIDDMKDMGNWRSVLIHGEFEEILEKESRDQAMHFLLNRYLPVISSVTTHLGEHWPFCPDDTSHIGGVVFRIAIETCTGRFETNMQSPSMAG